ncbi:hypothetical protein KY290_010263 [Solanum tuberosum]|uniref:Uncharacterized protein n=1 Tax=Solanum tuberosum TaxID=4113 RepID=A0ABQ7VXA3_SOLTU|nr:hypothetical protein KY290_010263 [Solanum tuberosum]
MFFPIVMGVVGNGGGGFWIWDAAMVKQFDDYRVCPWEAWGDTYKQKRGYNGQVFCDYCHTKGHTRGGCNKLKKCDFYHKTGHVKADCFQLIGYPADYKGKRQSNAVIGPLVHKGCNLSVVINLFNLDMIHSHNNVHNTRLPTGDSARVLHVGNCSLEGDYCVLHDLSSGKVMEIGKQKDVLYTLYSQAEKGTIGNSCYRDMVNYMRARPYTPHQNDVVEMRHRHILKTARAIKFQGGCLSFATNLTQKEKFSPRAVKAILAGYSTYQKGAQEDVTMLQYHFSYDDLTVHSLPVDIGSEDHEVLPPINVDIEKENNGVKMKGENNRANMGLPHENIGIVSDNNIEEVLPSNANTSDIRRSTRRSKPYIWHKDYVVKA